MVSFLEEINGTLSNVNCINSTASMSEHLLNFSEDKDILDCINLLKPLIHCISDSVLILDTNLSVLYNNSSAKLFFQRRTKILFDGDEYDFRAFIEKVVESSTSKIFQNIKITVKYNLNDYQKLSFDFLPLVANNNIIGFLFKASFIEELKQDFNDVQDLLCSFVHDLKTPLTATKINLANLINEDSVTKHTRDILEKLYHSHNESLDIVQSMLSVLKYDAYDSKKESESHSIAEILYKCLKNIEAVTLSKNISINLGKMDNSIHINFNFNEIQRLLTSLMMNCVSFLKENGFINIDFELVDEKFLQVKLSAKSNQKFIKSKLKNNFISSYLKNYESSFSLYLIKRIIEIHGGTLWVDSMSPNNIEFAFLLQVKSKEKHK